jgi:hypothetical protein
MSGWAGDCEASTESTLKGAETLWPGNDDGIAAGCFCLIERFIGTPQQSLAIARLFAP